METMEVLGMNYVAISILFGGLLLDSLNLYWGVSSKASNNRRSGTGVVPWFCYIGFVILADIGDGWMQKSIIITIFLVIHILCWQIVPSIFDHYRHVRKKGNRS